MTFNSFVPGRDRFFTVYICFKETLFFNFSCIQTISKYYLCVYYEIIKKLYMHTITGSSGRDCVLIKAGRFEGNLFSVVQYDHSPLPFSPNLYIGRKTNPILI